MSLSTFLCKYFADGKHHVTVGDVMKTIAWTIVGGVLFAAYVCGGFLSYVIVSPEHVFTYSIVNGACVSLFVVMTCAWTVALLAIGSDYVASIRIATCEHDEERP